MSEFDRLAAKFADHDLPFLDPRWRRDVLAPALSALLERVFVEHTTPAKNTALREAATEIAGLADHALRHLPFEARRCRCDELNDGEHKPQPVCHVCALHRIKSSAEGALKAEA